MGLESVFSAQKKDPAKLPGQITVICLMRR
ncbi:MAG: hypothetical protein JWR17_4715 [Pseudomonas sp.]|jgi:hypothetical protein|nr:hypothetical protein [Pseudomonas sp.]